MKREVKRDGSGMLPSRTGSGGYPPAKPDSQTQGADSQSLYESQLEEAWDAVFHASQRLDALLPLHGESKDKPLRMLYRTQIDGYTAALRELVAYVKANVAVMNYHVLWRIAWDLLQKVKAHLVFFNSNLDELEAERRQVR